MSERSARKFMTVAGAYAKTAVPADLGIEALYELAAPSTPDSVRTAVEELLVDGEKVTVADIKRMKVIRTIYRPSFLASRSRLCTS